MSTCVSGNVLLSFYCRT